MVRTSWNRRLNCINFGDELKILQGRRKVTILNHPNPTFVQASQFLFIYLFLM